MFRTTAAKLKLISDVDMYQFIEKHMRGGVSYIAQRYNGANNRQIEFYDIK